MHFIKLFAALAGLAGALPASATVIDFDTLPNGGTIPSETAITNQYASLGVTFSASAGGVAGAPDATTYSAGQANAYYSGNYLTNHAVSDGTSNELLATRYDLVSVLFSTAVSNVSFGLNTFATQAPVTVNAYDASGALLQSVILNEGGGWALDSLMANGISRINFVAGTNRNGSLFIYGIDKLTFTPNAVAVPEPTSWAMMIGGFGLIGGALRRRPRAAVAFA